MADKSPAPPPATQSDGSPWWLHTLGGRMYQVAGMVGNVLFFLFALLLLLSFPLQGLGMVFLSLVFLVTRGMLLRGTWGHVRVWLARLMAVGMLVCIEGIWHWHENRIYRLVVPVGEYYEDRPGRVGSYIRDPYFDKGFSASPDEGASFRFAKDTEPRVDGATSLLPLYGQLAWLAWPTDMRVRVNNSTTPQAYERLMSGDTDLIFVFRPSQEHVERLAKQGKEFFIAPIGYDAFVFFVNAENPVDSLTVEQLRAIYAGRMTRWSEAGGLKRSIVAFQRAANSGSQSRMERFMAGDTLTEPRTEWRVESMGGIVDRVARYRNYDNAIGYSFLYFVENQVDSHGIKLLAVNGVKPSAAAIRDGSYPLVDEICAVAIGDPPPATAAFIDWIRSPEGQNEVEKAGYAPLLPSTGGGHTSE